jgi:ATP-dependent Clp protease ATP-binding subunit ClpA
MFCTSASVQIEPDAAFSRRWQPIVVEEPSLEVAEACLAGVAPRYQAHHGVRFTPAALATAVRCAKR